MTAHESSIATDSLYLLAFVGPNLSNYKQIREQIGKRFGDAVIVIAGATTLPRGMNIELELLAMHGPQSQQHKRNVRKL